MNPPEQSGGLRSIRAAAKEIGIAHSSLNKAIRLGRITRSIVSEPDGETKIDVEALRVEWAEKSSRRAPTPATRVRQPHAVSIAELDDESEADDVPAEFDEGEGGSDAEKYLKARAKREAYTAKLTQLKYEEQAGTLVAADQVKKEAFDLARSIRDALFNLPDRLAQEFANETNPFVINRRLSAEIRHALEGLGKEENEPLP